jgi:hypothetical protein
MTTKATSLSLKIKKAKNNAHSEKQTWIGFYSGNSFDIRDAQGNTINNVNNAAKAKNYQGWYKLSDLSAGLTVNRFPAGRIFVCYMPDTSQPPAIEGGVMPSATNPDLPFYGVRYDKMEISYTGSPYDVADLTSIDFWAIPMKLKAYGPDGKVVATQHGLKPEVSAMSIYGALRDVTNGAADVVTATNFARIIGPGSYPSPPGLPASPYSSFESYLNYINKNLGPGTNKGGFLDGLGGGDIAVISGSFGGVGGATDPAHQPQTYNVTASISESKFVTLTGKGSQVDEFSMTFQETSSDGTVVNTLLGPTGIYGANAKFELTVGSGSSSKKYPPQTPQNDLYGWVAGDFLSGMNIGAIASTTMVPDTATTAFGALSSSEWFQASQSELFGNLQSSSTVDAPLYNYWAATLQQNSDDYNFAYTDRFQPAPFVTLNPELVDTLEITLENPQVLVIA